MQNFAAIDFETANNEQSSVCSVGVVIVRGEEIVDKFYRTTTMSCLMRRRVWLLRWKYCNSVCNIYE